MKIVWSEVKLNNKNNLCQKYLDESKCIALDNKPDIDILCECYREAGRKIAVDLVGNFACTIWDKKKQQYWCIRDQLGHTAFYYAFFDGNFVSASTLTQLLTLLPHKPKPNIEAMKEFAWYSGTINPEYTMYEGIFRLPPGHQMTVRNGKAKVSRYWHPKSITVDHSMTLEEASERFLHLFRQAVSYRLARNDKTGCELSGGLDSSSVFCIGKEEGGDMVSFSKRCTGMECDEGDYIEKVLKHTESRGFDIEIGSLDYSNHYDLNHYYSFAPHWPLRTSSFFGFPQLEAMQKNGITQALSGQGGDNVLIGSPMLCFDLLLDMKFMDFWREYRALRVSKKIVVRLFVKTMLERALPASLYDRLKRVKYKKILGEAPPPKSYKDYCEIPPRSTSFIETYSILNIASAKYAMFMDTNLYRVAKEHFGIDFQHPFLDVRVVEFLLSVPHQFKYSHGNIRQLHRHAMKGILPESVRVRRDKAAFNDLMDQHLKAVAEGFCWEEAHIVRLGILTQRTLNYLHAAYRQGVSGKKDYAHTWQYWRLINLEQWYRFNYDSDRA